LDVLIKLGGCWTERTAAGKGTTLTIDAEHAKMAEITFVNALCALDDPCVDRFVTTTVGCEADARRRRRRKRARSPARTAPTGSPSAAAAGCGPAARSPRWCRASGSGYSALPAGCCSATAPSNSEPARPGAEV